MLRADAEGAQLVVPMPQNTFGPFAPQHRDDMQRRRKSGPVRYTADSTIWASVVASTVIGGASQLSQWPHSQSNLSPKHVSSDRVRQYRLGQRDHLLQLRPHHPFLRVRRGRLRQPMPRLGDVLAAKQQSVSARVAIPPGPADLLVVGLGAIRHIQMHDKADIRPVDAHAESDRRHHDQRFAGAEAGAGLPACARIEPGVKRHGGKAFFAQFRRHAFGLARLPQ